jgi:hypothetical protein
MWQTLQGMVLLTTRNLKVFLWGAFVFVFFFTFFLGSEVASVLGAFPFHLFFYFLLFLLFFDRWPFGGKGNLDGRLEYSFKNDGIIEVCRSYIIRILEYAAILIYAVVVSGGI